MSSMCILMDDTEREVRELNVFLVEALIKTDELKILGLRG